LETFFKSNVEAMLENRKIHMVKENRDFVRINKNGQYFVESEQVMIGI
jgi:hypothetical protein